MVYTITSHPTFVSAQLVGKEFVENIDGVQMFMYIVEATNIHNHKRYYYRLYPSGYGEFEGLAPLPENIVMDIVRHGQKLDSFYSRIKFIHEHTMQLRNIHHVSLEEGDND